MKRDVLLYVVFVTGAVVLAVEVMAVRILAPFFGNTIFSFSSVITVILAALSVGYWYGGRLADRRPEEILFYKLVTLSGVTVLVVHLASAFILPVFASIFPLTYGPLIAAMVLFFIPALCFGLLSPMAIRLRTVADPTVGVGTVSGEVFFWSTLGSIFGSLSSGFVLIPYVGLHLSMVGSALLVVMVGVAGLYSHGATIKDIGPMVLGLVVLVVSNIALPLEQLQFGFPDATLLYDEDGYYEQVRVFEGQVYNSNARVLMLDRQLSSGITWPDAGLLFPYTQYIDLYRFFRPDMARAVVLGAGTGTVAKALHERYPDALIDMVDVEPKLFDLAHRFFEVPDAEQIREYVDDGRQFMQSQGDRTYDFIFGDMYSTLYSEPWHVTTLEYYQTIYEKLDDNGVYMGNYIGDLDFQHPTRVGASLRTLREVFDHVYLFAIQGPEVRKMQNCIIIAVKGENVFAPTSANLWLSPNKELVQYAEHAVSYDVDQLADQPIYTDDKTQTELVMAAMFARHSYE